MTGAVQQAKLSTSLLFNPVKRAGLRSPVPATSWIQSSRFTLDCLIPLGGSHCTRKHVLSAQSAIHVLFRWILKCSLGIVSAVGMHV